MIKTFHQIRRLLTSIRVGVFLAVRQIRRGNIWANALIVAIMTLTFLNLIVVSGILVGLIEGAVQAINRHYLGDIFISTLKEKYYIEKTPGLVSYIRSLPGVEDYTVRYIEGGIIEKDYKTSRKSTEKSDEISTLMSGIDPEREAQVSGLRDKVIKGSYLEENDFDQVIIGALLLKDYLPIDSPNFPVFENVSIGSKLRITINGNVREVTVKGITYTKVDEVDRRVFFPEKQFRGIIGRYDYNADEIVLRLSPETDAVSVRDTILAAGFGEFAKIQTREDAEPKFIKDMKETFNLLGTIIGSIGLIVASITIFIIIFINAIMRRKFIGILKGVGIHSRAIEFAYVLQSLFYAFLGSLFGVLIVFGFLEPYFQENPINFPFSDGILVATPEGAAWRVAVLFIFTFVAGYIPAKIVVRQNTLDAILGR
ncbi:MAG: hypothetical protein KGZ30_00700 [Anaplasmataceae bacterium]|nr:hypothetical protein [Anaplasmataceae bacterium]